MIKNRNILYILSTNYKKKYSAINLITYLIIFVQIKYTYILQNDN